MAQRICFISTPNNRKLYKELLTEFKYYSGFAISQKQKSIDSLHNSFLKNYPSHNILEISTKSTNTIGVAASAFNLKYFDSNSNNEYPIENIFQSSKVFKKGGPFQDLLNVHPREAKRDERLKSSGRLIYFKHNNHFWKLEPKTAFYDWIYISSLHRNKEIAENVLKYNTFTDIEFNHNKSINCQARAAAIYVSLVKNNQIDDAINNKDFILSLYPTGTKQISLFD